MSEFCHYQKSLCHARPKTNISSHHQDQLPNYIRVIVTTDSHGRKRELCIPAALDLDRPKRPRTTFQNWQTEAMEKEFRSSPFVTEEKRRDLARAIGITETQVKVWFQNRRTKDRKEKF